MPLPFQSLSWHQALNLENSSQPHSFIATGKLATPTLRTYLSFAVVLLIGITSAGIYGYLSQAFEQTLSQFQGYEKEISSLQDSRLTMTEELPHISFQVKKVPLVKKSRRKSVQDWRITLLRGERY